MNLTQFAYALVPIAIIYLLSTSRPSDDGGFYSAYRAVLTIALIAVLLMMVPYVRAYAALVIHTTQDSRKITAQLHKLSAADLQAEYLRARIVTPNAGLRCARAERDWDYVCSYMPTPFKSKTRLEFGVIVDETRVLKTSRTVPEGTTLPSPQ